MNKPESYQFIKKTLIKVDGLTLKEQIEHVKKNCNALPHLVEQIIEMLKTNGEHEDDVFDTPPILEHIFQNSELEPKSQINQYQIIKKIGSGGMGVVYSAKQEYPVERLVALKFISTIKKQKQLIEETNTLAQLNHPNIATLHEMDKTDEEQLYIVMELVEGQDIITWCKNHQYTTKQSIRLFQSVCAGIAYAHEKGVIHCDIKPSNVLITHKNRTATVKIIDFGISQHHDNISAYENIWLYVKSSG